MTTELEKLQAREDQLLCKTYGRYPLAVARAAGCRLYDFEGREYIDLLAGIAVANVGHCRPELTKAMAEQAAELVHVSNLFHQKPQLDLAEALLATCSLDRAFFCNSGAEANEAAIKLARRYARKVKNREAFEIVSLEGSFHGRTMGSLAATGQPRLHDGFEPLPAGFVHAPWRDIDALDKLVGPQTAAVLVEIVQGEGGVQPMDGDYARAVQKLCRERDALFMVDEVQSGLGRTGKMWAHQHFDLEPDVMTTAKALANGLPMGAMLATAEAAKGFEPGSHATTFGGGATLSAVALKVLELLQTEKLPERAAEIGAKALERFQLVKERHPEAIAEIRGLGLMIGVELAFDGQEVWRELLDRGFVMNLSHGRVLRLLPPLTIAMEDIEAFAGALEDVLSKRQA